MHSQVTAFLRMKGHSPFFFYPNPVASVGHRVKSGSFCLVCGFTSQSAAVVMLRWSFHHGSLNCCMFCCTLLYVNFIFAIILMGKRELIALLGLSSWCLVMVVWLFLAVPCVCLHFVTGIS